MCISQPHMGTPSLDEHNSVIFHPILKSWGCFEKEKASSFRWSSSCSHRFTRLGARIEPLAIMQPESWENNHHLILVKNSFFSKSAPKLIWLSLDFHYLRWEESENEGDGDGIWPLTPRQIWPIVAQTHWIFASRTAKKNRKQTTLHLWKENERMHLNTVLSYKGSYRLSVDKG